MSAWNNRTLGIIKKNFAINWRKKTMKKSEAYNLAQTAVLLSPCIAPERKLEVLRVLMSDEDVALFTEKREAQKAVAEE
jgi:hypothetical protein